MQNRSRLIAIGLAGLAWFAQVFSALAQAPGIPIEHQRTVTEKKMLEQAKALREAGRLVKAETITAQLQKPIPAPINLVKPRTKHLRGSEVAEHARKGYVRTGWYYLCKNCSNWHIRVAGGYAVAKNAIVTCHHCVVADNTIKEGYYIAVDPEDNVLPVTAVLAKSQTMDAAILMVEGGKFTPLPLSDKVAPGDPAYCYSDPLGVDGYFSSGIVNRFYWRPGKSGTPGTVDELKSLRVNVSTDWAPGSSGSAVLDDCGNVIGHVSTISAMSETPPRVPVVTPAPEKPKTPSTGTDEKKEPPKTVVPRDRFNGATLITLHEAVPARGVIALANTMKPASGKAAKK